MLHTAISEYLHTLDKSRQLEWQKVQGRFTNAPFLEPHEQLIQLIGAAIEKNIPPELPVCCLYSTGNESPHSLKLQLLMQPP